MLARLRRIAQQVPPGGALLFFDLFALYEVGTGHGCVCLLLVTNTVPPGQARR
jgi:hypothetical protein